jgi:hypothetical protein
LINFSILISLFLFIFKFLFPISSLVKIFSKFVFN